MVVHHEGQLLLRSLEREASTDADLRVSKAHTQWHTTFAPHHLLQDNMDAGLMQGSSARCSIVMGLQSERNTHVRD